MTLRKILKAIGSGAAIVAVGMFVASPHGRASGRSSDGNDDESRIKRGFEIAPVPLNLEGKNPALVGLGSTQWPTAMAATAPVLQPSMPRVEIRTLTKNRR